MGSEDPGQGYQDAPHGDYPDGPEFSTRYGQGAPAGFPGGSGFQDFPSGGVAGRVGGADDELPQISANLSDIAR